MRIFIAVRVARPHRDEKEMAAGNGVLLNVLLLV